MSNRRVVVLGSKKFIYRLLKTVLTVDLGFLNVALVLKMRKY